MNDTAELAARVHYICPQCREKVRYTADPPSYQCAHCNRKYPVLFGIPDFRLKSDRYLSLQDERDKARRLHIFAQDHSFDELVDEYYRITDDVPPAQAVKFARYVCQGVTRGAVVLPKLGAPGNGPLLDAGCGAGGLVVAAAATGHQVCGTDIALRWLVIAAKRLQESGLQAELVCADIAALPFDDARFGNLAAIDLFEHVENGDDTARALGRALAAGGKIHLAAANRYTLAPYPLAGLFGVGYLPAPLRRRYLTARRGLDTLRFASLQSPAGLARRLRRCGFCRLRTAALEIPAAQRDGARGLQKLLLSVYARLRRLPVLGRIVALIGPAFEITAIRSPASH